MLVFSKRFGSSAVISKIKPRGVVDPVTQKKVSLYVECLTIKNLECDMI